MSVFQIFSDGSCDMPLTVAESNQVKIIPFYVSFDQQNYKKELFELPLETFYQKIIGEKIFPKTSLPSVQDYVDAFTKALEEKKDILCFTITDTLSGSYHSAQTAKSMLLETYPEANIFIVNSWLATGCQYLMLLQAIKMRDAGFSAEQTEQKMQQLKATGRIMFMVGGLTHLQKGGRIGKIASLSGKILNIKPLIELKNGEINVAGVSQSRKKGLKKLSAVTRDYFTKNKENPEDYTFMVGTTNTPEEAQPFEEFVKEQIPQANFLKSFQIGATIATHTGPDTIGVCFLKNYDK